MEVEQRSLGVNNHFVEVIDEDAYLLMGLNHQGEVRVGRLEELDPSLIDSYETINRRIPISYLEEEI